jgi:hypothetical protein
MKLLSPAISSLARMRMWRIDAWKNNPIKPNVMFLNP